MLWSSLLFLSLPRAPYLFAGCILQKQIISAFSHILTFTNNLPTYQCLGRPSEYLIGTRNCCLWSVGLQSLGRCWWSLTSWVFSHRCMQSCSSAWNIRVALGIGTHQLLTTMWWIVFAVISLFRFRTLWPQLSRTRLIDYIVPHFWWLINPAWCACPTLVARYSFNCD